MDNNLEKEIRYRAMKIVETKGISREEALVIATEEIESRETALKEAKRNIHASKGRKIQKQKNEKNKRKQGTVYTVKGAVVDHIIQGGAPGMGKKSWNKTYT